jgi:hypothetical protein
VRAKSATMSLDHGAPIEALAYFPSGCVPPASVNALHSRQRGTYDTDTMLAKETGIGAAWQLMRYVSVQAQ